MTKTSTKFNFGMITEVAVCIFIAEILENIDFEKRRLTDDFITKSSGKEILKNVAAGKYIFGKSKTVRVLKDVNGDDVSVRIKLRGNKPTLEFFEEFQHHEEHYEKLRIVFDSLHIGAFARGVFIAKTSPYKDIHTIVDWVQAHLKNGVAEQLNLTIHATGTDSEKRTPPERITADFQFVAKADVAVELGSKNKKTGVKVQDKPVRFSVKGDSTAIEQMGASSAISLLYKLAQHDTKVFVDYFQPSLAVSGEEKKRFIKDFMEEMKLQGRIECSKRKVADYFRGLLMGSDQSTYLKVHKQVRTINIREAQARIMASKRAFIEHQGTSIVVQIEEKGKDVTVFKIYFTLSKKYVQAEINITTAFM